MDDGRVEAVLEGDEEAVKNLIQTCRRGPPFARVRDVEIVWSQHKGDIADFTVRH